MDWSVGYRVALASEESRRSTVVSRARAQFWALFAQTVWRTVSRGHGLAGSGAASSDLIPGRQQRAFADAGGTCKTPRVLRLDLPDVVGLVRQFEELPRLWNSCVDDLTGYSRAIGFQENR